MTHNDAFSGPDADPSGPHDTMCCICFAPVEDVYFDRWGGRHPICGKSACLGKLQGEDAQADFDAEVDSQIEYEREGR